MSEDKATRLLVSRSFTRKVGESFEKIILQAEASLASGLTLEEGFRDLNGTVLSALQEAAEAAGGPIATEVPEQEGVETELWKQLAQIFRQDAGLVAKVSSGFRLPLLSAPIQSFLIPRVLDAMWNKKNIQSYDIQETDDGFLTGIRVDLGEGTDAEKRVKELTGAIAWTLTRLYQKQPGATGK